MIEAALEVEVAQYVSQLRAHRDERGRAQVVRQRSWRGADGNGGLWNDEDSSAARERQARWWRASGKSVLASQILARRTSLRRLRANVSELLPLLYLRGLSTGDFREALPVLIGDEAAGLSPSSITRLVSVWQEEYQAWKKRSLADRDYVYVWADGVHFGVRLEDERL